MALKRYLLERAFEELGLASYVFNVTPDEEEPALFRLENMMAQWLSRGIDLGYIQGTVLVPASLSQESGIDPAFEECVYMNLATKIAPQFGKSVMPKTASAAQDLFNDMLTATQTIPDMSYQTRMPRGAGNRRRYLGWGSNYYLSGETATGND